MGGMRGQTELDELLGGMVGEYPVRMFQAIVFGKVV